MALTDAQVDAAYSALNGGTPIFEIVKTMDLGVKPQELRSALVEKYGRDVVAEVIREKVQPNMGPARRVKMMVTRVIENNPEKAQEIKTALMDYLNTL